MFSTENVPVILRSLKLSLEDDDDEGGTLRFCSTTFRIGLLSFERAEAITDVPVIAQCFGPDRLPLWNVDLVRFAAPKQQYTMELRSAPDAPALLTLPLVDIEKAKVWRPKPTQRDLALEFVTKHEVASTRAISGTSCRCGSPARCTRRSWACNSVWTWPMKPPPATDKLKRLRRAVLADLRVALRSPQGDRTKGHVEALRHVLTRIEVLTGRRTVGP